MLILKRKEGERIILNKGEITLQVVEIGRGYVRLGIQAPKSVEIHREEVFNEINNLPPPVITKHVDKKKQFIEEEQILNQPRLIDYMKGRKQK